MQTLNNAYAFFERIIVSVSIAIFQQVELQNVNNNNLYNTRTISCSEPLVLNERLKIKNRLAHCVW